VGTARRFAGYLRAAVIGGVERRIDPGLQLEQAVSEARRQDVELRTQAARVIALRTEIELRLDREVDDREKLHEHAAEALRAADGAARRGDTATAEQMTRGARAAAVRLEAADAAVEGLKTQYGAAREQAEQAKLAVQDNALELERLSARRLELVSKLEQAKLQEQVNRAVAGLRRPVDAGAPTLADIELKIERRMALASAAAELESASPEGQRRELERSLTELAADRRLSQMRQELGLAPPVEPPAIEARQVDSSEGAAT
jgi:phage shock protein A